MPTKPEELRASIRGLVRRLGVLNTDREVTGVSHGASYCHALVALHEATEPLMQRDLAEVLHLNKSSVTRLCRRLEDAGHLEISAHAEDGRARNLELTESGQALAVRVNATSRARFAALLALIPRAQHASILGSLEVLNAALGTLEQE